MHAHTLISTVHEETLTEFNTIIKKKKNTQTSRKRIVPQHQIRFELGVNFEITVKTMNTLIQFSPSVVSDSLRPHELQHARLPIHHQLPEFTQTHVRQVSDYIQPSHPVSFPSPPAPNLSQHQDLFQ